MSREERFLTGGMMGRSQRFLKDPEATLDYSVDWSAWLGEDTISTSTWTVPMGLTKAGESYTSRVATVWLRGGVAGTQYSVVNRIVTVGGRQDERTLYIVVEHR